MIAEIEKGSPRWGEPQEIYNQHPPTEWMRSYKARNFYFGGRDEKKLV
jgi:hypothetical protein